METYNGHIRTPGDCLVLFEACRLGLLPRVQRRLSEKERQSIRTGSVFVWDEREAGMRRWTDGKSWSASRVSGSFLTYREMEGKRGSSSFVPPTGNKPGTSRPDGASHSPDGEDADDGPDGYRYKPDGLMKQSFSLTTSTGQHLHLISYFSRTHPTSQHMRQPTSDPTLAHIQIPKGMYPESTITDAINTPAVTRSPMPGAPAYVMAAGAGFARPTPPPPPPGFVPGYIPHPGYLYPLSPVHTPPGAYPLYHAPGYPPLYHPGYPHALPNLGLGQAPPTIFDQRPQNRPIPPPPDPGRRTSELPRHSSFHEINQQALALAGHVPLQQLTPKSDGPPQIDPRLTESTAQPPAPHAYPTHTPPEIPRQSSQAYAAPSPAATVAPLPQPALPATLAPSMSSLIHAVQQASPLPTRAEAQSDKDGSVSPGGTRHGAPPQDIPSEKLAFREDKMALSKLDRVFARV